MSSPDRDPFDPTQQSREVFLHDISLDDAWQRFSRALQEASCWSPLPAERVPVAEALGRVTAEPIWARLSAPHYHSSAMDGFAVRAEDTTGATETRPQRLELVRPGVDPNQVLRPAQSVNTGHPLPAWANAVIMVEQVQLLNDHDEPIPGIESQAIAIEVRAAATPWQHVRALGEDMVATELVLPANHVLRPVDLGAVAGSGHTYVAARRRPRVAIIPTGSELVAVEEDLRPGAGQIIEYNSIVLASQVLAWGGLPDRWPIVPDRPQAIRNAVLEAAREHDLVLLNAGSSAGTEDHAASVIATVGELLVHGVAVRPGHPVILGIISLPSPTYPDASAASGGNAVARRVPVVGVPGYPVSAALTGEIFVEPLISRWLGRPPARPPHMEAIITRGVHSPIGDDEFLRVSVGKVGDRIVATPLSRGAGTISSLVRADGIVKIPRFSEGVAAGDRVTVHLYRPPDEVLNTIVAIGSHDLTLDLLAQFVADRSPGTRLASANVGSLGGLIALRRGEAHLGGAHLLDPDTGEYNSSYVRRYLPDRAVVLVTLVEREQGFLVPRGNPQMIAGWDDLSRGDVSFVNRQRGAGTRLLLDHEMGRRAISPGSIKGYERQEYTHLAVAAAVASGTADFGLGIRAAATALALDFVPLAFERYDLVIPREYYHSSLLEPLLALLNDQAFREAVAEMPGYSIREMGSVREV